DQNLEQFEADFQQQYKQCENKIQEKLAFVHKEFDKYMQTHETQGKLARLLDQQITRINQHQQQQADGSLVSSCQELLDKTNDLMNAVSYLDITRDRDAEKITFPNPRVGPTVADRENRWISTQFSFLFQRMGHWVGLSPSTQPAG
ncbi:unnamed protein product, partial [Rotaria magnacalcarata]